MGVKEKDKSLFQDVKNLLVHKFAFLINCNICFMKISIIWLKII